MISLSDLKTLLDALPYPVFGKREDHVIIYGNRHFSDVMGTEDYIGKSDAEFFPKEQNAVFRREDSKVFAGEQSYNEERIGETLLALTSKFPVTLGGGSKGLVGIVLDVNREAKQSLGAAESKPWTSPVSDDRVEALEAMLIATMQEKREALERALSDPATGIRNRSGLDQDLEQAVSRYRDTGDPFALAFVDLDFFKRINDRHGHDFGDQVLQVIANRLSSIPAVGSVARLGGDEFAVLLELKANDSLHAQQQKFDALHIALSQPIELEEKRVEMTCSTGISLFPEHGEDIKHLKQHADAALLTSKAKGRNRVTLFSDEIRDAAERRRMLEDALHAAVADKAILPFFQPIVCSETEDLLGVEVLARWEHPVLGAIAPDEFIAIASDCGLLSKLDKVVFENGCSVIKPLLLSGQVGQVSFNVSATDITDPLFAQNLLGRTHETGLDPAHICVEVVETESIHDIEAAKTNLATLQQAGMCIALDDFGTGYSNLRSLLDLPLDRVKIDRSLIRDMESNQAVFDLFLTIVNLAGILDVTMVAEGLETDFNALMVASAGVTHLQGFYFAKPMDQAALFQWIETREASSKTREPIANSAA